MLQATINHRQEKVSGAVRLKLYKGGVFVVRKSLHSQYSEKVVTFEDDAGVYDQRDAAGQGLTLALLCIQEKCSCPFPNHD